MSDKVACEGFQRLIKGLVLSGLRITESWHLHWTDEKKIRVDFSGEFPMLHFPPRYQKNKKQQTVPITPDFAAFLQETPEDERDWYVFNIQLPNGHRASERYVPKAICKIGRATGIETGEGSHPTSHDFRRTFATNWCVKVPPATLMTLCRHASIQTTLNFYATDLANIIAKQLWGDEKTG